MLTALVDPTPAFLVLWKLGMVLGWIGFGLALWGLWTSGDHS